MAKPVTVTNTFNTLSGNIPLVYLDQNFNNILTALNDTLTYSNYLVDTGSANSYVVTFNASLTTSYTAGLMLVFQAANANTGPSTLNVNSLGAKAIVNNDNNPLVSGQISANRLVLVCYDGTNFVMLNDPSGENIIPGNLTVGGSLNLSAGTANGVAYLNGSKAVTSGTALQFDGTNLGIGTTGPSYRLDVRGTVNTIQARFGNVASGGLTIGTSSISGTNDAGVVFNAPTITNGTLIFQTDSADRMRLTTSVLSTDSSINVGIGTASPSKKLDIRANVLGESALALISNDNTSGTSGSPTVASIEFASSGVAKASIAAAVYGNDWLSFRTGSNTERMRLDSSGNLLVGNTSNYGVGAAESNYIEVKSGIVFAANNTGSANNRNWTINSNGSAAGNLDFTVSSANNNWPNSAYAMSLTRDSNLGIGLNGSLSAWGGTLASGQLELKASALFTFSSSGGGIATNAYYSSANQWIYKAAASTPAALYQQFSGGHTWYTIAAGTAGNTISWGDAKMSLTAAGNLGIVNTSPDYNLSVGIPGTTANSYIQLGSTTTGTGNIFFGDTTGTGTGSYSGYIQYDHNVNALIFATSATERARITSGGYAKFSNNGTYAGSTGSYHELITNASDPTYIWSRHASTPNGIYAKFDSAAPNNATQYFLFCQDNTPAERATIRSNGGLANYQANNVNLSDARTKTDIKPVGSYWDKIKAIEIVTFKYKDQTHDDDNIGAIAQQVESVAPEFVDVDGFGETPEDGVPLKTVYTTDMYHAAIKALQEAMTRIEQLEAKVADLEA